MNVLITRGQDQLDATAQVFSAHGLRPFGLPLIDYDRIANPVFKYSVYDLCVITSPTAAVFFALLLHENTIRVKRYAAVGEKTAEAITAHTDVDKEDIFIPEQAYQADLIKLLAQEDLTGQKVLSPGPEARTGDMEPFFTAAGALYDRVDIYKTVPVIYQEKTVENFVEKHNINVLTFFSPSAVNAYMMQAKIPASIKVAAVGTTTAAALDKYGVHAIMPNKQNVTSMAEMLSKESEL